MLGLLDAKEASSVSTILCGGEALPQSLVDKWGEQARLLNVYGPTEATVDALFCSCASGLPADTIGQPFPNMRAYVLDPALRLLPVGFKGILWVSGVQLARGYNNLPDKTAAVFVPNPFVGPDEPAYGRMYNTGDVAERRGDGYFRCFGRIDHQVKVRGFRIELASVQVRPDSGLCFPLAMSGGAANTHPTCPLLLLCSPC